MDHIQKYPDCEENISLIDTNHDEPSLTTCDRSWNLVREDSVDQVSVGSETLENLVDSRRTHSPDASMHQHGSAIAIASKMCIEVSVIRFMCSSFHL